ncbi:MBL fold metallo-hydrolase [Aquincola sp. MAHUQ-54]|uniref:MBL fold metallo-hydrolase n=1 Tax=Aquincola agrisoli TaxID=3119538 RepID=A0AAW9Q6U8_9BURK
MFDALNRSAADPEGRPPRPSATIVVVRESPAGPEVLLLRRAERGDHNSGAWVFPGGLVDAGDAGCATCCDGVGEATANERLGVPRGGIDYYVAAVRECFEECGLLFARDASGAMVREDVVAGLDGYRAPLHRGETSLPELCRAQGLALALDALAYYAHWVTPLGMPKRFDTRFFVAEAPAGQAAMHDAAETVEHRWLRPADVLADRAAFRMLTPTLTTLELIARHPTAAGFLAWARALREVPTIQPRLGTGQQGRRPVTPDEPAWAEIGRLDPHGHGVACYDIQTGVPVRLSPHLIRVTAGNGSVMTGPGTNTYLVGGGPRNEWAVIDPGPSSAAHVQAVLAAAPGPIRQILVTHTHTDHSPATVALKAATQATVMGRVALHPMWQDPSFSPDRVLEGGERIAVDDGVTLRAIHTPGHASNHICYLLEEEKTLFTGDHVMQLSTVVINPPDGDMRAYIASLRELSTGEDLDWLAPGHGFLMARPRQAMEAIIAHRLRREAKVVEAMRRLGPSTVEQLLPAVYDDVPPRLHPVAMRSLQAHLLKLRDDAAAVEREAVWSLA